MNDADVARLDENIRDLAAAVETVIAALLTTADNRTESLELLRAAQTMASLIRQGIHDEPAANETAPHA